jgi:tetratricopeptide (TPR) repeat protein
MHSAKAREVRAAGPAEFTLFILTGKEPGPMNWQKYQEAMDLQEAGHAREALQLLQELDGTANDPAELGAWFAGITNCTRLLHRTDEAREFVKKAYKVLEKNNPSYPEINFVDALIEEAVGNWKKALEKFDSILERNRAVLEDPENEDFKKSVIEHRGCILFNLKRYAEARPILESAQAKGFSYYAALFYLGACCYALGDLAACKRHMKAALSFDLDSKYQIFVHYHLGLAHLWSGEYAWARQEFEWCFQQNDQSRIWRDAVLTGLVKASEALGLKDEVRKYSEMLDR